VLPDRTSWIWALVAAAADALAFLLIRPNVGDLEAALARQSAAASGVGLTYWFDWFSGGSAPGSYSVLTPVLSTVLGAPFVGALATVAAIPLVHRTLAGTRRAVTGTWVAAALTAANLWAGRIPFALGVAVAVGAVLAVRRGRPAVAVVCGVASMLCSPVPGAFLAFAMAAAALRERAYRRVGIAVCGGCLLAFVGIALIFGSPGPEGFAVASGLLTAASALVMLLARPAPTVRVALWCTAAAAVLLTAFPNGMGSNFTRLPWICLPVAVVATGSARRRLVALAVLPAVALAANATVVDLVRSRAPSASAQYYGPLLRQLTRMHGLDDYRVEVVSNPAIHTAAYVLVGHAALAGGYETQEQNAVNGLLSDPTRLNAVSYKVWLDNNAVGLVALDRTAVNTSPEYELVSRNPPAYLHLVSRTTKWLLYRVQHATPIVPPPIRVVAATQAQLRIAVPCACRVPLRVRFSKYLTATSPSGRTVASLRNDGTGWTVLRSPRPGIYVLHGQLGPLH
jgi:hypothetical protein